jgi:hypothetical protein
LESSDPVAATKRYLETLSEGGMSISGQRVLVFGYGGRFAVGVELLKHGAEHVILCDHFVLLDRERNLQLFPQYAEYLVMDGDEVKPHPQFITLLHGDIRESSLSNQIQPVDFVLSTSVYEHLDDAAGITHALAALTEPMGAHLHFIDLQDHYFKYPFEMLTFSERVWKLFLNPTSNLNRLRFRDYRKIFDDSFYDVDIRVLGRREAEFEKARPRIRPEFLTGDLSVDAITSIQILARHPRSQR